MKRFVTVRFQKLVVAKSVEVITNPCRQALGLMFRRKPKPVLFEFSHSRPVAITNLFVFFPLDLVWFDENRRIVGLRENFPAWTPHCPSPAPARYVLELPAGTIKTRRVSVGQKCKFTEEVCSKPF